LLGRRAKARLFHRNEADCEDEPIHRLAGWSGVIGNLRGIYISFGLTELRRFVEVEKSEIGMIGFGGNLRGFRTG
jgi:hypothetical protein